MALKFRTILLAVSGIALLFCSYVVNKLARGVPRSQHLKGEAVDCKVRDASKLLENEVHYCSDLYNLLISGTFLM